MKSPLGLPWALLLAASPALAAGCARTAEERQLESMREEIENSHDVRERTEGPGAASAQGSQRFQVPPAYSSGESPQAPMSAVQLGGDPSGATDLDSADPQDTTPRPTIRVLGATRGSGRGAGRVDEVSETGTDDPTAPPADAPVLDPEAKRAYDAALTLVNAKHYDEALDALARFLVKWPDHPYANNAMYWRGECYFARGDFPHAAEQFEGVLARFPAGNKVPDALLKLGLTQQKLGNAAKAKEYFDRLAQEHPDSEAARHIPPAAAPKEHR